MEKLIIVLLLTTTVLFGQKKPVHKKATLQYAPTCLDSASVIQEKPLLYTGHWSFFGGETALKRYLYYNLNTIISNKKMPLWTVSFSVEIDTFGISKGISSFTSDIDSCEACNGLIVKTIESIYRWKPNCYFDFWKNKIICEEEQLKIKFYVKEGSLFIVTTE